jgi:nanoRNase/pAp phosphatase (c-di-AMP/oligoRNAs hydrolase)
MLHSFAAALAAQIEKADTIVLGRHIQPDPDAFGSQLGLASWLKDKYPHKTILCAGEGEGMDAIADAIIEDPNTLVIVTDTSTAERIDDQRLRKNDNLWRIDHHVNVAPYTPKEKELVLDGAAASCELVALLLKDLDQTISKEAAQLLLEGLYADTQRLTIKTVTPKTMEAAAWLLEQKADPSLAAYHLYSKTLRDFSYGNAVRTKAVLQDKCLFSVMSAAEYLALGMDFKQAKDHVDDLQGVLDVEIWLLLTEMDTPGQYSASVRSRRISVRDIAESFGGGGHECACGIRPLNAGQCAELIELLAARSLENDQ